MTEIQAIQIEAVTKETLKEGVVQSLRTAILDQKLKPGQRIPESRMATKLGVSRAPVREALAVLQQEGLIHRGAAGLVVANLTQVDVDEVGSLRLALEQLAVREAIRNGSAEDFDRLEENIRRTEESKQTGAAGQRDVEFHELVVRAAKHERLLGAWLSLRSQIKFLLLRMELDTCEYARSTAECHRELLSAIRAGDEVRALELLETQLENTHQMVARHMAEAE